MKILCQEICSSGLDWDKMFTLEIKGQLYKWVNDLLLTREIKLSRCLYEASDRVLFA